MTTLSETEPPSPRPEDVIAFTLGDREVSIGEVVRAAHFRGDVQTYWQRLLEKLACLEEAATRELAADHEAIQERANQFRYSHDLISAEETERWFEKRNLSLKDFSAYVLRSCWKDALGKTVSVEPEDFSTAETERRDLLTVELLLTNAFDWMAQSFAWRLAAWRLGEVSEAILAERMAVERSRFFARIGLDPSQLAPWLEARGGNEAWLEEMLAAEAAFGRQCEILLTPEQLARELRSQRLALMRFEVEEMEFDTLDAAHEAALCVSEDGLSMEDVARESGYPYAQLQFLADDLSEERRIVLLSTSEGGLAGPLVTDGLFRLFRLQRKIEATLEDQAIRSRLEQRVLHSCFDELCAKQGLKLLLSETGE